MGRKPDITPQTISHDGYSAETQELERKLIWPSVKLSENPQEFESELVPQKYLIQTRYRIFSDSSVEKPMLGSVSFWQRLPHTLSISIIDQHWGEFETERLTKCVLVSDSITQRIRIISGIATSELRNARTIWRRDADKFKTMAKGKELEIKYLNRQSVMFPHDRFAVLDLELWHFGHTVGAMKGALSAYSRGWDVRENRFGIFFNELWQNDAQGIGK